MELSAATQYLTDWIVKDLSVQHEQLAGLSKCPFARKAYLDGKVAFVLAQGDALSEIMAAADGFDDSRDVVVFILSDDLPQDC